jgi:hypothetical protein
MAADIVAGAMGNDARTAPGPRFDIHSTIAALTNLRANTYFYLIWQNSHDWEDLPAFADEAARHGISVWVYLVPWSETPPHKVNGWGYSEPFRNDYVRWAREIAQLSLAHRNIAGYVIDDFLDNTPQPDRFTREYVREMTDTAKHVNPSIKFYPLMYFQTPWADFLDDYAGMIDGVVICYPKSESGIRNALTYLNDRPHGPTVILQLPRKDGAHPGDIATATCEVPVLDPRIAEMSFYFDATDRADNPGREIARVRVNGRALWESPTAGQRRDGVIDLDLSRVAAGQHRLQLAFELKATQEGTPENMSVIARFDDIRMYGIGSRESQYVPDVAWRAMTIGKFQSRIIHPMQRIGRFHLPVIVMPAGDSEQFEKRYDRVATPQSIASFFGMGVDLARGGLIQGVVGYRIPMRTENAKLLAISQEYARLRDARPTTRATQP